MKEKQNINSYAKFSTIVLQMAIIITVGTYAGLKLDEYSETNIIYTVILSLLSVATAIYLAIKDIINFTKNKLDEK